MPIPDYHVSRDNLSGGDPQDYCVTVVNDARRSSLHAAQLVFFKKGEKISATLYIMVPQGWAENAALFNGQVDNDILSMDPHPNLFTPAKWPKEEEFLKLKLRSIHAVCKATSINNRAEGPLPAMERAIRHLHDKKFLGPQARQMLLDSLKEVKKAGPQGWDSVSWDFLKQTPIR